MPYDDIVSDTELSDDISESVEDNPQTVVLSDEQLAQILDAIGETKQESYALDSGQYEQIIALLDDNEIQTGIRADAQSELEALNQNTDILTYILLTTSILIGVMIMMFFRRK